MKIIFCIGNNTFLSNSNLKSTNILLWSDGTVKITDINIFSFTEKSIESIKSLYSAPEILLYNKAT